VTLVCECVDGVDKLDEVNMRDVDRCGVEGEMRRAAMM